MYVNECEFIKCLDFSKAMWIENRENQKDIQISPVEYVTIWNFCSNTKRKSNFMKVESWRQFVQPGWLTQLPQTAPDTQFVDYFLEKLSMSPTLRGTQHAVKLQGRLWGFHSVFERPEIDYHGDRIEYTKGAPFMGIIIRDWVEASFVLF